MATSPVSQFPHLSNTRGFISPRTLEALTQVIETHNPTEEFARMAKQALVNAVTRTGTTVTSGTDGDIYTINFTGTTTVSTVVKVENGVISLMFSAVPVQREDMPSPVKVGVKMVLHGRSVSISVGQSKFFFHGTFAKFGKPSYASRTNKWVNSKKLGVLEVAF
jgi:hypothetical protein